MREINAIVIHHSADPQKDSDKALNNINQTHKKALHPTPNGYGYHIAYHFVIMKDGNVIKTRPIKEIGYHAGNWDVNTKSVGICLSWNFEVEKPTKEQLEAMRDLISELQSGYWNKLEIKLHREIKPTACPGKNFTRELLVEPDNTNPQVYKELLSDCWTYRGKIENQEIKDYLHKISNIIRAM